MRRILWRRRFTGALVFALLSVSGTLHAQFQFDSEPQETVVRENERGETEGKANETVEETPAPVSEDAPQPPPSVKTDRTAVPKKTAKNKTTPTETGPNGPRYGKARTQSWTTGVRLTALDPCSDMFFLIVLPMDWPEQTVSILAEKATNNYARVTRVEHPNGGLRYLRIAVPKLRAGDATEVSLTVETARKEILPPSPESIAKLSIPQKVPRAMKVYLDPGPQIENDKAVFRTLYRDITKDLVSDWEKIEAIYKWVQTNIVYSDLTREKIGKGAVETLKQKVGDCKDMTAVFIAICRAGKIPARSVRVPEHCYAEFYMEDDEGFGYWFPCQVSGSYAFGGIPETGPVLQKGDIFTFRELPREKFRFFDREVVGKTPGRQPKYEFFGGPSK